MKKLILTLALAAGSICAFAQNYEYKMFTTVESVVPGGMGRSRLIATDKDSQMLEKDLENFFSLVGINFKNIQNNDIIIAAKINEYSKDGWELNQVVNGVYAAEKSTGIFITRYIFRKLAK